LTGENMAFITIFFLSYSTCNFILALSPSRKQFTTNIRKGSVIFFVLLVLSSSVVIALLNCSHVENAELKGVIINNSAILLQAVLAYGFLFGGGGDALWPLLYLFLFPHARCKDAQMLKIRKSELDYCKSWFITPLLCIFLFLWMSLQFIHV